MIFWRFNDILIAHFIKSGYFYSPWGEHYDSNPQLEMNKYQKKYVKLED